MLSHVTIYNRKFVIEIPKILQKIHFFAALINIVFYSLLQNLLLQLAKMDSNMRKFKPLVV